ncbi:MAG: hypothetical protein M5T61_13205 [Acidimicrobiia bacterium]|nr:hypothetical protein [Acidimicrobiia bacterium]
MLRTVRRAVLVLLLIAVVGFAATAVTARPGLDRARDDATSTWRSVRGPLTARYDLLSAVGDAVRAAGGIGSGVVDDLDAASDRWRAAASGSPVSEQVAAANALEGDLPAPRSDRRVLRAPQWRRGRRRGLRRPCRSRRPRGGEGVQRGRARLRVGARRTSPQPGSGPPRLRRDTGARPGDLPAP